MFKDNIELKVTGTALHTMPVKIFKKLAIQLAPTLCRLINFSIEKAEFPNPLKIARVSPIYKTDNCEIRNNYRPMASLPYLSKLFERNAYDKLISFFSRFGILSEVQFGFRNSKSTRDALINLTEMIYAGLNDEKTYRKCIYRSA